MTGSIRKTHIFLNMKLLYSVFLPIQITWHLLKRRRPPEHLDLKLSEKKGEHTLESAGLAARL